MNRACSDFRERLADSLSGTAGTAPELTALSWHEHLLGCADCRALLEAEEALETLLATLPQPALPPDLTERLLVRLRSLDEGALDELLEQDQVGHVEAPENLASDVLAALRPHRGAAADERTERALDRLLDRVPAPEPPEELTDRVLRGLETHRERRRPTALPHTAEPVGAPLGRRPAGVWPRVLAAAAALAVFGWAAWMIRAGRSEHVGPTDPDGTVVAVVDENPPVDPVDEEVPTELLASLDLLESWDVLAEDDLDLALAALDEVDLLILELEAEGS